MKYFFWGTGSDTMSGLLENINIFFKDIRGNQRIVVAHQNYSTVFSEENGVFHYVFLTYYFN